jgi:hypothetical protein
VDRTPKANQPKVRVRQSGPHFRPPGTAESDGRRPGRSIEIDRRVLPQRQNPQLQALFELCGGNSPDLPGIRDALAATRHLLEMYRRQISDDKNGRRPQRLDRRLLDVDQQLQNIAAESGKLKRPKRCRKKRPRSARARPSSGNASTSRVRPSVPFRSPYR